MKLDNFLLMTQYVHITFPCPPSSLGAMQNEPRQLLHTQGCFTAWKHWVQEIANLTRGWWQTCLSPLERKIGVFCLFVCFVLFFPLESKQIFPGERWETLLSLKVYRISVFKETLILASKVVCKTKVLPVAQKTWKCQNYGELSPSTVV